LSTDRGAPFELAAYRLPDLSLPSGSVVAADLLLLNEEKPFARRIKPGDYPLTLVAARFRENDELIAFAMLHFCDRPVAMWEVAAVETGKKSPVSHQRGYGVDSGTGGFCDAGALE